MAANRAKSKSPNPSFCSVLSRVKDWELGAFTPKTALADNVDVMNRSNVPFSDSDREMSDQGESKPPSGWTLGSPPREEATAAAAAAATGAAGAASAAVAANAAKVGAIATGGASGAAGKNVTSGLVKSALSSNIGESCNKDREEVRLETAKWLKMIRDGWGHRITHSFGLCVQICTTLLWPRKICVG